MKQNAAFKAATTIRSDDQQTQYRHQTWLYRRPSNPIPPSNLTVQTTNKPNTAIKLSYSRSFFFLLFCSARSLVMTFLCSDSVLSLPARGMKNFSRVLERASSDDRGIFSTALGFVKSGDTVCQNGRCELLIISLAEKRHRWGMPLIIRPVFFVGEMDRF